MMGLTFTKDEKAGTYDASVAFLVLVKDSTGQPVRKIRREIPIRGALERMEQYREGNLSYSDSFSVPPGKYTMETVVLDRTGGRASVKRSVLMVPERPAGVALGSLMFVKRVENRGEMEVAGDPFAIGNSKVVPQLSDVVSNASASELPVFVSLFPDLRAQGATTLRFEVSKGGKSVRRIEQPLWPADESGRIAMVVRLPISNLEPGRYDLRAVARQGESAAEQRIAFEIK